jgi:hypothetical protein
MKLQKYRQFGSFLMVATLAFVSMPSLADKLTDDVVRSLRQADADISVNQVDENQLKLTKASQGILVNLDNLRRICQLNNSSCARETQTLVKTSIDLLAPANDQLQDSRQLRIVIRGQDYLDDITRQFNQQRKVPLRFVSRALSDSLVAMIVVDSPRAVSPLRL